MAGGRIKGITIEIDGNTTQLQKSLADVDKSLEATQKELKDVNKLLKFDPKNTELLKQKQDLLGQAVKDTTKKLDQLKEAQRQMEAAGVDKNSAQYRALTREIADTENQLKRFKGQLEEVGESAEKSGMSLKDFGDKAKQVSEKTKLLSAGAAAVGTAMVGMAFQAGKTADDLLTLSRNTGISVEDLQKMQYASDLVDVSMDQMTGSLAKLTKQMGSGSKVFEELGVAITDENGNMRDAIDVWYDSLEALSKIPNETERDTVAMELFGRSAMELSGIVDDGGQALKDLGQNAEDMGLILSGDAVQSAGEFNDALDTLKATAQQSFFEAGAALADSLLPMLGELVQTVSDVLVWFGDLDGNTQTLILTILALVAAISPIAGLISAITTIGGALAVVTAPMAATFMGIAAAIGAVVAIGVVLYENWDTIKAKGIELWNSITTTWEGIKETISSAIESAKQTVSDCIEAIKNLFNFQITWPHIPLPHFSVSGSANPLDWLKGGLPSISVDWYAKAKDQPYLFNSPQIIGVGDVPEVVVGADYFKNMGQNITVSPVVNIYGNVDDYDALARKVSDRINVDMQKKMRIY